MSQADKDELISRLERLAEVVLQTQLKSQFAQWSSDLRKLYTEAVISCLTRDERITLMDRLQQMLMDEDYRDLDSPTSPRSDVSTTQGHDLLTPSESSHTKEFFARESHRSAESDGSPWDAEHPRPPDIPFEPDEDKS